jgi:hypothetical protein
MSAIISKKKVSVASVRSQLKEIGCKLTGKKDARGKVRKKL